MGAECGRGRCEFSAAVFAAELRIRDRFPMAIGIAKVHSRFRRMIEFIRWLIVPEIIPPVIREPEVMACWIPIESDRVPDSMCHDLVTAPIRIHAGDQGIPVGIRVADIAWGTDGHIEFPVWPEGDELPSMMCLLWKAIRNGYRCGRVRQPLFDLVESQDAIHSGNV